MIYGSTVLRQKSAPVEAITDTVRTLARDMLETMYASNGLGLAAQQVGRREALCVIDVPPLKRDDGLTYNENPDVPMPLVLINPRITAREGRQVGDEGCLSFPELYAGVERAAVVTVAYLGLDGAPHDLQVRGLLARAVQHELDHLNGVLLVDRMSPVKRVAVSGKLKRLRARGMAQG